MLTCEGVVCGAEGLSKGVRQVLKGSRVLSLTAWETAVPCMGGSGFQAVQPRE